MSARQTSRKETAGKVRGGGGEERGAGNERVRECAVFEKCGTLDGWEDKSEDAYGIPRRGSEGRLSFFLNKKRR